MLREGRKVAAAVGKEVFGTLSGEERDQLNGILRKLSGLDAP